MFDVIVVGGGGSGLAAAVSAADEGASVLLLEKLAHLGGTTGIAIGSYTASRTRLQQRAGVRDDIDAHAEDIAKFAPPEVEQLNNEALRRFFMMQASDTLDWLTSMGLRFFGPSPEPPNRVPRMHNVVPNARAYIAVLQSRFLQRGGSILCSAPVEGLTSGQGRIIGVTATVDGAQKQFIARCGVVLASGDYTNSSDLIRRHKGTRYTNIEGINPYATGDGHILAERAGARLLNMDVTYGPEIRFVAPPGKAFLQLLPTRGPVAAGLSRLVPLMPRALMNLLIKRLLVTWQHPEDALFEDGALLVNNSGVRFCDETKHPDREIAVADQPGKVCYILLDGRLVERYSRWPNYVSTAPEIAYAYVQDYVRIRPDVAVRGASLEELARHRGMPASGLQATVDARNQELTATGRSPLEGDKWALLGPAKAYFTSADGCVAINQGFQVLDTAGQAIEGLYAVGSIGLGGQILWSHGTHIAWALTSGRLAGQALAEKCRMMAVQPNYTNQSAA